MRVVSVTRACPTLKLQRNVELFSLLQRLTEPGHCSPPIILWPTCGCSHHCQSQKMWILLTLLLRHWSKNDVARLHVRARRSVSTLLWCWDQNQVPLAGGHMSQSRFFQKTLQVAQTARVSDLSTEKDTSAPQELHLYTENVLLVLSYCQKSWNSFLPVC